MALAKAKQYQMQLEETKGEASALRIELKNMEVSDMIFSVVLFCMAYYLCVVGRRG